MPDVFTKAKRSVVMSRIRGHGNKDTELALMKFSASTELRKASRYGAKCRKNWGGCLLARPFDYWCF